jgi:thioredoxin 1
MATKTVTDRDFETLIKNGDRPVLVDFWAEWCGPCKALGPKLEEISSELGDKVSILKLNVDDNPMSAQKFAIRSIPTMLIFKNGQKVGQLVGNLPKDEIVSSLTKHV